jgi:hypothetical protein
LDCAEARERIEEVTLAGWPGLPEGCRASAFGELPDPGEWAVRPLGEDFQPAAFRVLEIPGYYRPTISVREGVVVLFDGMNPQIDEAALAALLHELGEPAARLDYARGTLPVSGGELACPERGITLFVNAQADRLLHVALYAPTDLRRYRALLRLRLGVSPLPRA